MYAYFNENPLSKRTGDCVIRALSLVTGYTWEQIKDLDGIKDIDVIAEGEFVEELKDNNIEWVGSSNQRVINVKESLNGELVLH